ncbi:MAG: tetratricopeptide repeat protein [Candidatus Uhrbacteria bacterium]
MNQLLSNTEDSDLLQKAWDMDQKALFSKNKKEQEKLWGDSLSICKKLFQMYKTKTPDNLQILSKIALIYLHQKKFDSSKRYMDIANTISKNNPVTLFNYGNLYRAMEKPLTAIKYYEKAIKHSEVPIFKEELEKYRKLLKENDIK